MSEAAVDIGVFGIYCFLTFPDITWGEIEDMWYSLSYQQKVQYTREARDAQQARQKVELDKMLEPLNERIRNGKG